MPATATASRTRRSSAAHRELMADYYAWRESWELQAEAATHGHLSDLADESVAHAYGLAEAPTFRAFLVARRLDREAAEARAAELDQLDRELEQLVAELNVTTVDGRPVADTTTAPEAPAMTVTLTPAELVAAQPSHHLAGTGDPGASVTRLVNAGRVVDGRAGRPATADLVEAIGRVGARAAEVNPDHPVTSVLRVLELQDHVLVVVERRGRGRAVYALAIRADGTIGADVTAWQGYGRCPAGTADVVDKKLRAAEADRIAVDRAADAAIRACGLVAGHRIPFAGPVVVGALVGAHRFDRDRRGIIAAVSPTGARVLFAYATPTHPADVLSSWLKVGELFHAETMRS